MSETSEDGAVFTGPAAGAALLDPASIMQVGMGFWPSKALLSAVELGLFTTLGSEALIGATDRGPPSAAFPCLVPTSSTRSSRCGSSSATGDGDDARYRNTPETARSSTRNSPQYIGGILEMANARLYRFWGDLTEALQTGQPQNEIKHTGHVDVRGALQRPGPARAVHAGDVGHLRRQLLGSRGEVRLLPLPVRSATSAEQPASCRSSSRSATRTCSARASTYPSSSPIATRTIAAAGLADRIKAVVWRLLRRSPPHGRRDHDGHDPARLEPGAEACSSSGPPTTLCPRAAPSLSSRT